MKSDNHASYPSLAYICVLFKAIPLGVGTMLSLISIAQGYAGMKFVLIFLESMDFHGLEKTLVSMPRDVWLKGGGLLLVHNAVYVIRAWQPGCIFRTKGSVSKFGTPKCPAPYLEDGLPGLVSIVARTTPMYKP